MRESSSKKTARPMLAALAATLLIVLAFSGCSVNRSIRVGDGETIDHSLSTVNGSIVVGARCKVQGRCRTVNGSIDVGSESEVRDIATVNGSVETGDDVTVNGDLGTVNGSIECGAGTQVDGDISNVNGLVRLRGTTVNGSVSTHTGSIRLLQGTIVEEDVIIKRSGGDHDDRALEIEVVEGSIIKGDVEVRNRDREVVVILGSDGEVRGEIRGAEVRQQTSPED